MTTKGAAPAALSQGLFLDGRRQMVFNSSASSEIFKQQKNMTHLQTP
jgi:hypothetical protein